MKSTRILSVFTTLLISLASYADVVYEPLVVDSGFNRDCIAETTSIGSSAWSPLYDLTSGNAHTSCFGTRSVIASINSTQGFTDEDYAKTIAGGWPDDNGNPDDRVIRCSTEYLADAYQNPTFANVYWRLAPYNGPNVLTLRPGDPDDDAKGWHASGTLTFQKIGCYDQLFFLMASLRQGSGVGQRKVTTIVHYTDGSTSNQEFLFAGLGGEEGQRVKITNIYESPFKKNTAKDNNLAYVSVFPMDVNPHKLIQSIEFTNNITNTSAIIFAVTGRTAAIDTPDDEISQTSDVTESSFVISWEGVPEAETYRVDVATDVDFQNMVEGYNNQLVSKNDTIVLGLDADEDYYWRVRSVNADGGQSASSAPRCARTAGNNPPLAKEDDDDIEGELAPYAGYRAVLTELDINRTLYKDGYFNTICLPFSLATLDGTPLAGGELFEFVSATKNGDQLDLTIEPAASLEAGKPYLIRWPNTGEVLTSLTFHNVNVTTATGQIIGEEDEIRFVGHIGQQQIALGDTHNLFVGENNVLYWPDNTDEKMLGFRAYFALPTTDPVTNAPIRRYMPAQLIIRNEYSMPTEVESGKSKAESRKIMENGQLYIIHNGVLYNTLGAKIREEVKR